MDVTASDQSWTQLQNLYDMGMIGRAEFERQRDSLLSDEPAASAPPAAGGGGGDDEPSTPQQQADAHKKEEQLSAAARQKALDDFVPGIHETPADASGIKVVTEYRINDAGQHVKSVRQVKVVKKETQIKRSVLARRQIAKFGRCAGMPRGPESGVTCSGDRVWLEVPQEEKKPAAEKKDSAVNYTVSCRSCGAIGDHWTMQCPYKDRLINMDDLLAGGDGSAVAEEQPEALASGKPGKYKPPGARGEGGGSTMPEDRAREISSTIRVTNLSEDTSEQDVRDLFSRFGAVQRVYLARNKQQQSRGFAFVSFYSRREAEKAMETLQGFGYDSLILRLEWAAPSRN